MRVQTQKFETHQWFILPSTIALTLWGEGGGGGGGAAVLYATKGRHLYTC